MAYVALLRGINVGRRSAVNMGRLKAEFERLGLRDVRTYVNSGNVVFSGDDRDRSKLRERIERVVAADLGVDVLVLLRDTAEMQKVVDVLPPTWCNDSHYRCDVLFSDEFISPESTEKLPLTPGLEEVRFVPGAIVRRIARSDQSKSRLTRIVGTDLYKQLTIRNCNVVRKLHEILLDTDASTTVR